jgi:hypothetical protein
MIEQEHNKKTYFYTALNIGLTSFLIGVGVLAMVSLNQTEYNMPTGEYHSSHIQEKVIVCSIGQCGFAIKNFIPKIELIGE